MTDLELIFSMLGEASTTNIARAKNTKGFNENKQAAIAGGQVAGNARKELEQRSGEKVVKSENYLLEKKVEQRKVTIYKLYTIIYKLILTPSQTAVFPHQS